MKTGTRKKRLPGNIQFPGSPLQLFPLEPVNGCGIVGFPGSHNRAFKLLFMHRIRKILRLKAYGLPLLIDGSFLPRFLYDEVTRIELHAGKICIYLHLDPCLLRIH